MTKIKQNDKPCKSCLKGKRLPGRTICQSCLRKQEREKKLLSLAKKKERKLNSKKYQLSQRKKLMKECWAIMSEFVRRSEKGICYTCGKQQNWKDSHAGHRHHGKLNFDGRNIHCQCPHCNTYLHGNLGAYERHLIEDIGLEGARQLERDAWKHGNNYSIETLNLIKIALTAKLQEYDNTNN